MKTIAKRNPPRPSFHERLKVSGYAMIVNRIGEIRSTIIAKLELNRNVFVTISYQDLLLSERACFPLFLPNKLHVLDLAQR